MKKKVLATYKGKKLGYVLIDEADQITKTATKTEASSMWKLPYETTKNGVGDFEDLTDTYKKTRGAQYSTPSLQAIHKRTEASLKELDFS